MNATLASQLLEDPAITKPEKAKKSQAHHPTGFHFYFLLPAVAVFVATLPFVYFGLAGLIGWGLWEYSALVSESFADLPEYLRYAIAFLPTVPAGLLIAALLGPVFAIRQLQQDAFAVSQDSEPMLISFINRIADTAGAPRPDVVELDCEPRVAAFLDQGHGRSEIRLLIGMPLISGLSLQSFGGALARELGPFSQPFELRLRRLIDRVGSGFQQMAEWRSPIESKLEKFSARAKSLRSEDRHWSARIAVPCLFAVRALMVLVRWLLRMFAKLIEVTSAFIFRHLEFRADAYQIAFSGSENFSATIRRLARLEAASRLGRERIASLIEENRLSRDYPNLIRRISENLPREAAAAISEQFNRASTWSDRIPSPHPRIQSAHRRDDAGIFSSEKPASSLVRDPGSLGEIVTRHWYRSEWKIDANRFELVSNEVLNRDLTRANRQLEEASDFFGRSLNPFRPIFPTREAIDQFSGLPEISTESISKAAAVQVERYREALERFDELVLSRLQAVGMHQLALAGYPIDPGRGIREDSDTESLNSVIEFLDRQLLQASIGLEPFEEHCARMIAVAVRNLGADSRQASQVDIWFHHLAVVEQIYSVIPKLKELATRLGVLIERQPDSDLSVQCGKRFEIHVEVCELLKRIEDYLGNLPYPFDDCGDDATMWDYLTADIGTRNEAVAQSGAIANAVVDRVGEFYLRVMGQLAIDLNQEPEEDDSKLFDRWAKLASL